MNVTSAQRHTFSDARNRVISKLSPLLLPVYRNAGRTFRYGDIDLPYFAHIYNTAHLNERTIEIPIAQHYLERANKVLEVGNVMKHYFPFRHDVVDKFERAEGVINCDVRAFRTEKKYDLIFSISTLEHVGWDEQPQESPSAFHDAIRVLHSLLDRDGLLMYTVPVGYNRWLDEQFRNRSVPYSSMQAFRRLNLINSWRECPFEETTLAAYGKPYLAANGLLVVLLRKSL